MTYLLIGSVKITDNGRKALVNLCKGNMRHFLNVMQVCPPAFFFRLFSKKKACHSGYGKVDEDAVYKCTGSPHPRQIAQIVERMLNDEFQTSFKRIPHFSLYHQAFSSKMWSQLPLTVRAFFLLLPSGIQDIKINHGLALQDIISSIYDYLRTIVFEKNAQIYILDQLSHIELSIFFACS